MDVLTGVAAARLTERVLDLIRTRRADVDFDAVCNSFPTGTEVLMADGTHVAIEDIDAGDRVVAFDTETSTWTTRTVNNQWGHLDEGTLTAVTLADGSSVTSTAEHLYWSLDAGDDQWEWVEAQHLDDGDYLATPDGNVEVANIVTTVGSPEWVWELSVQTDHNFTVHTGTVDVVVHNAAIDACGLRLNTSAHHSAIKVADANTRQGEVRDELGAASLVHLNGNLGFQVHHILPRTLVSSDFIVGTIAERSRSALLTTAARLRALGYDVDSLENLIPLPSRNSELDDLIDNQDFDWPRGQIHNGNHPAQYYERLGEFFVDITPSSSLPEIERALSNAFEAIRDGSLRPRTPRDQDVA